MLRKVVLLGALVLASHAVEARTLQFGYSGGIEYYQTDISRSQANGEVFFNVTGYVLNQKTREKVPFRALFNCGSRSKIAVDIAGLKKVLYVERRLESMFSNLSNWYALQDANCPNQHYDISPDKLQFPR